MIADQKKQMFWRRVLPIAAIALLTIAGSGCAGKKQAAGESVPTAASAVRPGDKESIDLFWKTYRAAEKARMEGDCGRALSAYDDALAIDPDHETSLFYSALCLRDLGRHREAAERLEELSKRHPHGTKAFSELGDLYLLNAPGFPAEPAKARRAYEAALRLNKEDSQIFLRLGLLEKSEGNRAEAKSRFKEAVRLNPDYKEAWHELGLMAEEEGDAAEAVADYEKVLSGPVMQKFAEKGFALEGQTQNETQKHLYALFQDARDRIERLKPKR